VRRDCKQGFQTSMIKQKDSRQDGLQIHKIGSKMNVRECFMFREEIQ
jgi:hypothetical protein